MDWSRRKALKCQFPRETRLDATTSVEFMSSFSLQTVFCYLNGAVISGLYNYYIKEKQVAVNN